VITEYRLLITRVPGDDGASRTVAACTEDEDDDEIGVAFYRIRLIWFYFGIGG
jgi:hypothetical protein